jgi:phytoene dehydrogenase-like protein
MAETTVTDVAVVGGGLGGLAAATYAARGGRSVILCEKASTLGGRAATTHAGRFRFNLGPHALYAGSHGIAVLRELNVPFTGLPPSPSGGFAVARGAKHALPGGFLSLLSTGLFGLGPKLETARLLGGIARIDPRPLHRMTMSYWLASHIRHGEVRQLVEALVRLTSYSDDPERLSAGTALAQLQSALKSNVLYLDGGWETLVNGLRAAAEAAGVGLRTGGRAVGIERTAIGWRVGLADGTSIDAAAVIVAAGPETVAALVPPAMRAEVQSWSGAAIPVRAACLDLALSKLPQPRATFALGIDRPLYFSVHSAAATLGPPGSAVVHAAKYLGRAGGDAKADELELERLMDLVQPGWRSLVVERRFLPDMLVANALPTAVSGGTGGRPGPAVPNAEDLYVVGDWVGPDGLLADATLASAKRAAAMLLERASRAGRAAA